MSIFVKRLLTEAVWGSKITGGTSRSYAALSRSCLSRSSLDDNDEDDDEFNACFLFSMLYDSKWRIRTHEITFQKQ